MQKDNGSEKISLFIVANSVSSFYGLSGGDKIFLELARYWKNFHNVQILVCPEARALCNRSKLAVPLTNISFAPMKKWGIYTASIMRIISSLFRVPRAKKSVIYSSSDFLTDVLPALLFKLRNRKAIWIAGIYLLAPKPVQKLKWQGMRAFLYFLTQRISIILMKLFADQIWVLNNSDKEFLTKQLKFTKEKINIIHGGVDLDVIQNIKIEEKNWDACFLGRFHKQKGLDDLVHICSEIAKKKKDFSCAVIGWGSSKEVKKVFDLAKSMSCSQHLDFMGAIDGPSKYEILKAAKVFIFPSTHESFGIVALEALACGVPVLAYNLRILQEIYGDNLIYFQKGDFEGFAQKALELIENETTRNQIIKKSKEFVYNSSWEKVAQKCLIYIEALMAQNAKLKN